MIHSFLEKFKKKKEIKKELPNEGHFIRIPNEDLKAIMDLGWCCGNNIKTKQGQIITVWIESKEKAEAFDKKQEQKKNED